MAQTLTDIKTLLTAHGLRPKHKFGQNFLHDGNHMARILEAAAIKPGELILEVGPGTGALTERLLDEGARVLAVEIDTDMEAILRTRVGGRPGGDRLELIIGDALDGKHALNPAIIEQIGDQPFKLIANLPYHVASPLMLNLVRDHPGLSLGVVMVQKEVADRMAAGPGGKDYGAMGIMMQALCEVSRVGTLSPGCFWPAPKVASAVARFERLEHPLTDDADALGDLLQRLFSKRRKQLGAILGRDTQLPEGMTHDQRPEQLSVEQLVALAGCVGGGDAK